MLIFNNLGVKDSGFDSQVSRFDKINELQSLDISGSASLPSERLGYLVAAVGYCPQNLHFC